MDITIEVIELTGKIVLEMLKAHRRDLNRAYLEAEEELSAAVKLAWKPTGADGVRVVADLNFIAERIKDRAQGELHRHKQMPLAMALVSSVMPDDRRGARARARWYRHR
jgi:hypothetical protein